MKYVKIHSNYTLENEHIFITGYPCSGKTKVAKDIAKLLNMDAIHLDTVPGMDKTKNTTNFTKRIVKNLDTPSVVEGVQLMDFDVSYFKNKQFYVLKVPHKTLVNRIIKRGFQDTPSGPIINIKRKDNIDRAISFLNQFKDAYKNITRSVKPISQKSLLTNIYINNPNKEE